MNNFPMYPMNQMNQMNHMNLNNQINQLINIYQINQINNQNMDQNNFWINLSQINLINSIIDFFHKTGNDYMNYNEKGQIMNLVNLLNSNSSNLKQSNEIKYSLDYIKEEKRLIKFINSDFVIFNVRIPISFSKKDLYQIALFYRFSGNSEILLVYKNDILKKDESSIESFSDDDIIIIVENRVFPDDSYYKSLFENNKGDDILNILFNEAGKIKNPIFPKYITVGQMLKAFYLKYGFRRNDIIFDDTHLINKINKTLSEINPLIIYSKTGFILGYCLYIFGKKIIAKVSFKNTDKNLSFEIGTLNSTKDLINKIKVGMRDPNSLKKIYLDEKEISLINESLSSIGITKDFNCLVETDNK